MRISDWSSDVCSSDLHVVVRTEEQRYLDIDHRVSGHHARRQGFLNALVDGRDVLARNHTALDGVDEFVAATWLERLELEDNVTVFAATAGLLDELAFDFFPGLAYGFAVGNLSFAHVGLYTKLATHTIAHKYKEHGRAP